MKSKFQDKTKNNVNLKKEYLMDLMKRAEEAARKSKDPKINQLIKKRSNF